MQEETTIKSSHKKKEGTMNDSIKTLTVKDLMEIMGIGRDRAYALMHSAGFPSTRLGRTYFVTQENFYKWLNDNKGKAYRL